MDEHISFPSTIKSNQSTTQTSVTTNNGNVWRLQERWYVDESDLIQEITLKREDIFETHYYVTLEISPIPDERSSNRGGCRIEKSTRAGSFDVRFEIYLSEYRYMRDFSNDLVAVQNNCSDPAAAAAANNVDRGSDEPDDDNVERYRFRLVLSPILQLAEASKDPSRKCRRRVKTKGRFVDGLKLLASDIHSLLEDDTNADVILYCGKKIAHAHRNVLSVRSSRFFKIFHRCAKGDLRGGNPGEQHHHPGAQSSRGSEDVGDSELETMIQSISQLDDATDIDKSNTFLFNPRPHGNAFYDIDLDDIGEWMFEGFLSFIYNGHYKPVDFEKTKAFHAAACSYGLNDLKAKCLLSMAPEVNKDNFFEVVDYACSIDHERLVQHSFYALKKEEHKRDFAESNSEKWHEIRVKYPKLDMYIFDAKDDRDCNEFAVPKFLIFNK